MYNPFKNQLKTEFKKQIRNDGEQKTLKTIKITSRLKNCVDSNCN